jgi:hypothetical protein
VTTRRGCLTENLSRRVIRNTSHHIKQLGQFFFFNLAKVGWIADDDNFVGHLKLTDKNVGAGLGAEAFTPDPVLLHLVADDSFRGIEQLRRLSAVSA